MAKKAKYKVRNAQGKYEVIHFETDMNQVEGLEAAMEEKADKANFEESFRKVNEKVGSVGEIAKGLGSSVQTIEAGYKENAKDIQEEKERALAEEGRIREEIGNIQSSLNDSVNADIESLEAKIAENTKKVNEEEATATAQEKIIEETLKTKVNSSDFDDKKQQIDTSLQDKASIESLSQAWDRFNDTLNTKATEEEIRNAVTQDLETVANLYADQEKVKVDSTVAAEIEEVNKEILRVGKDADNNLEEIEKLQLTTLNKNATTQVYKNMEEFVEKVNALQPKKGDLVYIIDGKKSYIYTTKVVIVPFGAEQPPAGWELFDSISTEADLSAYIKTDEVDRRASTVTAKLGEEYNRATDREGQLNRKIESVLEKVEQEKVNRGSDIQDTEGKLEAFEKELDSKIDTGLPFVGRPEPIDREKDHIWIDMDLES